jgi:hypothetical protein
MSINGKFFAFQAEAVGSTPTVCILNVLKAQIQNVFNERVELLYNKKKARNCKKFKQLLSL